MSVPEEKKEKVIVVFIVICCQFFLQGLTFLTVSSLGRDLFTISNDWHEGTMPPEINIHTDRH